VPSPTAVQTVTLHYTLAGSGITNTLALLDDGLSGDGGAGDTVYGGTLPSGTFPSGGLVHYWLIAQNSAGATTRAPFNPAATYFVVIGGSQTVFINELMASNTFSHLGRGAYTADVNDFEDWLELYNPSGSPIDLSGYTLTNDLANPTLWEIPAGTTIAANGHRLFWAMGTDAATPNSTNFKISASGGQLALYDPAQNLVDAVLVRPPNHRCRLRPHHRRLPRLGLFWHSHGRGQQQHGRFPPHPQPNRSRPPILPRGRLLQPPPKPRPEHVPCPEPRFGSPPTAAIPTQGGAGSTLYTAPLAINSTTVVRARTFAARATCPAAPKPAPISSTLPTPLACPSSPTPSNPPTGRATT
jgi:hypothetical protein